MSFTEVEIWRVAADVPLEKHDESIRQWMDWVQDNQVELFPEWKSVRYYAEIDHDDRTPTGRYVMLFEFYDMAGRDAYKERRKDWSGPYADYKKVDPYQFFDHSSVTLDFWESREEDRWLDFSATA